MIEKELKAQQITNIICCLYSIGICLGLYFNIELISAYIYSIVILIFCNICNYIKYSYWNFSIVTITSIFIMFSAVLFSVNIFICFMNALILMFICVAVNIIVFGFNIVLSARVKDKNLIAIKKSIEILTKNLEIRVLVNAFIYYLFAFIISFAILIVGYNSFIFNYVFLPFVVQATYCLMRYITDAVLYKLPKVHIAKIAIAFEIGRAHV